MGPDLSRRAAQAMRLISPEGRKLILDSIGDKETVAQVSQPVRGWIEDPSSIPAEYVYNPQG